MFLNPRNAVSDELAVTHRRLFASKKFRQRRAGIRRIRAGWSRSRSVRAGSESPQDFHSLPAPRLRRARLRFAQRRDCYDFKAENRSFSGSKARFSNAEMQAKPPKLHFWDLETHSNLLYQK